MTSCFVANRTVKILKWDGHSYNIQLKGNIRQHNNPKSTYRRVRNQRKNTTKCLHRVFSENKKCLCAVSTSFQTTSKGMSRRYSSIECVVQDVQNLPQVLLRLRSPDLQFANQGQHPGRWIEWATNFNTGYCVKVLSEIMLEKQSHKLMMGFFSSKEAYIRHHGPMCSKISILLLSDWCKCS